METAHLGLTRPFMCGKVHPIKPSSPRGKASCHPPPSLSNRKTAVRSSEAATTEMRQFLETEPYRPPPWAAELTPVTTRQPQTQIKSFKTQVPRERVSLGLFPTPICPWKIPDLPPDVEVWIKRDDMSGNELSGHKVRKMEFLLADAKAQGCDCIITAGSFQSNNCRVTAVAARYLGLQAHLILYNSSTKIESDPGLEGNLLLDRMVGAHIHQVTGLEYMQMGSKTLTKILAEQLRKNGHKPYIIPVGGSNPLVTWGYLESVKEIMEQTPPSEPFTDIITTSSSGASLSGLALGIALSGFPVTLHSYGVCASPGFFYDEIERLFSAMGALPLLNGRSVEDIFNAVHAAGSGYAISRPEELECIKRISSATGVILDPVYNGKSMFRFLQDVRQNPKKWKGRKVLFIHTGGLTSVFSRIDHLQPFMESLGTLHRMDITK